MFVVEEKPHNRFQREGDDLVIKLNITLSQALLGPDGGGTITKEVDQLDGRRVEVSLPEGVSAADPSRFFSADVVASRPARSGNPSPRRGYANLKGWLGQAKGRFDCSMERRLPHTNHPGTKAGTEKGPQLKDAIDHRSEKRESTKGRKGGIECT